VLPIRAKKADENLIEKDGGSGGTSKIDHEEEEAANLQKKR